jgi:hypothetical protein
VSLTDSAFADGGGYVADDGAGIAVLPDGDTFPRGRTLRVTGEIDDRFGQRTLRVGTGGIVDLGSGIDPVVSSVTTGAIGEELEGRLVRIAATLQGPASTLTSGVAFDVDDGSGVSRLVVAGATGIDVGTWGTGTRVDLVGVVGQRDSTGTGTTGYRVQPRDGADVVVVEAPATPTPTPSGAADPSTAPAASASPEEGVQTIAEARGAPRNARVRIQGTITLPTGVVDSQTAAIQDASGAILLRLSDEAGGLRRGQRVDVSGTRSTKSGMETIRVTTAPRPLGTVDEPAPAVVGTGAAGEAHEARLVVVRGGLVTAARRSSSGTVSMEIDDGSGPLRVVVGASLELERSLLAAGTWIEVRGVLGQETTGAEPLRGYRVWPRTLDDLRVTAGATDAGALAGDGSSASGGPGPEIGGLDGLDSPADGLAVGATLVVGGWPELNLAGVLWDGERLVGLAAADAARVTAAIGERRPPVPLELHGLRRAGERADPGIALAIIGGSGRILVTNRPAAAPATARPGPDDPPVWYAVVGRLEGPPASPRIRTVSGTIPIDRRCAGPDPLPRGLVTASGIAVPGRPALVVPCGGIVPGVRLHRTLAAGRRGPWAAEADDARVAAEIAPSAATVTALAPALLAAASLVLAGLAGWMWWRPTEPDTAADPASPTEPDAAPGDAESSASAAPVLTLVPLPRERSP